MFNSQKYIEFVKSNADVVIPVFGTVRAPYMAHTYCLAKSILSMGNVADNGDFIFDRPLFLTALLCDIDLPYIVNNKDFSRGHEDITKERLSEFLSEDDEDFEEVYALIRAHMAPYISKYWETPFKDEADMQLMDFFRENGAELTSKLFIFHTRDASVNNIITDNIIESVERAINQLV